MVTKECSSVLREVIYSMAQAKRDVVGELDQHDVALAVRDHIRAGYPWVAQEIAASAELEYYEQQVGAFLRHDVAPFAAHHRQSQETHRIAERKQSDARRWVHFIDGEGIRHYKKRVDVLQREIPYVIAYREKQRDAHDRDIAWWKDVAEQMVLAGLGEDARVGDIVREA